jgi:hypothetical protein
MSMEKLNCPKCCSEMVQGFILDLAFPYMAVSQWVEGPPKKSFFLVPKSQKISPSQRLRSVAQSAGTSNRMLALSSGQSSRRVVAVPSLRS